MIDYKSVVSFVAGAVVGSKVDERRACFCGCLQESCSCDTDPNTSAWSPVHAVSDASERGQHT